MGHVAAVIAGALASGSLIVALAASPPRAQAATQCSAAAPRSADGHWVYRTVQGRKCWYRGPQVIAKAELIWPQTSKDDGSDASKDTAAPLRDAQAKFLPTAANDERHAPPPTAAAVEAMTEVRAEPARDSFDARWRGLPR